MTFTDSCIAKDKSGEPTVFRVGQKVRVMLDNCPQLYGVTVTVKSCFYQNTTLGEGGLAVLLDELSWSFCKDLEVV
jgi:hypothetical protein